jgi:hypothetical protein
MCLLEVPCFNMLHNLVNNIKVQASYWEAESRSADQDIPRPSCNTKPPYRVHGRDRSPYPDPDEPSPHRHISFF